MNKEDFKKMMRDYEKFETDSRKKIMEMHNSLYEGLTTRRCSIEDILELHLGIDNSKEKLKIEVDYDYDDCEDSPVGYHVTKYNLETKEHNPFCIFCNIHTGYL